MVRGILIPIDEDLELQEVHVDGFEDYQKLVGGMFQCLDIESPSATLFSHEEGKLIGLVMNRRATLIWWLHDERFRDVDALMGEVVLVGQPDKDGNTQDIPDELFALLMETPLYKMQVQTVGDGDAWSGNAIRYDNWPDAYSHVMLLASNWFAVTAVRVVPA